MADKGNTKRQPLFGSERANNKKLKVILGEGTSLLGTEQQNNSKRSLVASIFGSERGNDTLTASRSSTSTSTGDIFGASKTDQLNKLTQERQAQHRLQHQEQEPNNAEPKFILKARQDRTEATQTLVRSLTLAIPKEFGKIIQEPDAFRGTSRLFVSHAEHSFHGAGVLILQKGGNIFSKKLLKTLRHNATAIEQDVCQRLDQVGKPWQVTTEEEAGSAASRLLEQDHCFQYQEVASRCLGRLDIRHRMDQPPFNAPDVVANPLLMPLIHALLGPQAKLVYAGLILSFPESADQPWHQDGAALFDGAPSVVGDLPPYALNVFVPLEPVTEALGPTEFWVGSHKESACRQIMTQLQAGKDQSTNTNIIGPLLRTGDVLIYDYRMCHRGARNLSQKVRPMLYLMYARPWFYEHLNFGTERLFPNPNNNNNNKK
jgi:hypothetical protein